MNKRNLNIYSVDVSSCLPLPFADQGVKAGFPSPAQDYIDHAIDLNKELIRHPATTFFARVDGDSMIEADLHHGDILLIDRSEEIIDGKLYVCFIDGDFTVKRIRIEKEVVWLIPENPAYEPIRVTEENEFMIWGRVMYVIKPK
ncbi:MAG: translesion error-prone DNA polymerase V autoproteolytic subunit [Bacteroides sp.]|nr:translesion error-prone DNA polymerase V autoproteolytic subunit [Bacteroides sp.]